MSLLIPPRNVNVPTGLPQAIDGKIDDRLRRGREARDKNKNLRELCRKMWAGDQYSFMTPAGGLSYQVAGGAGIVGAGKPVNRIRNTYNYVQMMVEAKVSAATQQIPGYEVTPSTDDPEDASAAALSGQVAIYGYDKWRIRRHTTKAVTEAIVSREAFVMPYFDPNVGPFAPDPQTGEMVGKGEIRHLNLSRDQVMWEPGEDFDDSRWHAIDRSVRVEDILELPGYVTGSVDQRRGGRGWDGKSAGEKVTLTEYLERPCPKYPEGRRIFTAFGRPIVDYRLTPDGEGSDDWWEPFPCVDAKGVVVDEPPLHRISYTVNPDPDGDDMGLVERMLDPQRTINDCQNKILEIKNRALLLQMLVPKGAGMPRRDDTPGATYEYNAALGQKPEWERPPDPGFLSQLLEIRRAAIEEIRALAADVDIQPTARLAEGTAQLAQTSSDARWQSFLGDLAEFHSRLMRHDLTLVARHYDTQRQVDIRGQYGWQSLASFSGQDLRSQVNVRVLPGSLATKSRQAIQAEIQFVQANWPGAISPEAALATLHGGSSEALLRSYENDVAKAWRVVTRLKDGDPETTDVLESFGARWDPSLPDLSPPEPVVNPETGEELMSPVPNINPITGEQLPPPPPKMGVWVPNWMPGPQDKIEIWRTVVGDYMKTLDFESLPPGNQELFWQIWQGLEDAEQQRAARQAAQQQMQAQSLGMGNASKNPGPPPLPDRAGFTPENASPVPAA